MDVTTTTRIEARAFAVLNPDGSVSVKVTGHAPYATDMQTSAEITTADLPADKVAAVKALLTEILDSQAQKLGVLVQHAMHESRRVGRIQGELDASFTPTKKIETTEVADA
jgi:hypothetical protein